MATPGLAIHYFYAPISAYSYLGEPRLIQIAREAGVNVLFKPVDILPVFKAAGATPPAKQSAPKIAYRQADVARTAARLGLPINPAPAYWPVPMALAAKTIIATGLIGADQHQVSMAIMGAIQAEDLDISSAETLQGVLSQLGLPANELLDAAQGDKAADLLTENIEDAINQQVRGAPTYIVGDQTFFGQDRLVDLQWWLGQSQISDKI